MTFTTTTTTTATATATAMHWGSTTAPKWLNMEMISMPLGIEGFLCFQEACSGSHFGTTKEETLEWVKAHEEELHQEAQQYSKDGVGYCLPMGYCPFGVWHQDEILLIWYQTTSGTILAQKWAGEECQCYVGIPSHRDHGFHHRQLTLVAGGLTRELYRKWYNSYLFKGADDPRFGLYAEEVAFCNPILVQEGFEPLPTGEDLLSARAKRTEEHGEEYDEEYDEEYEEYDEE